MAHEVKSPENQPQFSQMKMGQYWLAITKLKQAFRLTRNTFKKLPWNFQKAVVTELKVGSIMLGLLNRQ